MNPDRYRQIQDTLVPYGARLVAVSKTRPEADIQQLYDVGHRLFGENKVQEMEGKQTNLPKDIQWHLIGHLQSNKVKYIAPFVSMIHSIDSLRLLAEVDRQAKKCNRVIPCLLQIHISGEETKFGLNQWEADELLSDPSMLTMKNIEIAGLMGMASNTDDTSKIESEFAGLKKLFDSLRMHYFIGKPAFRELSMGMSSDYLIGLKHGATLVRIGSDIFGAR
ncbi:MAG: YggS family pyridoxal phosphate-dependent enzyme [Bacteroidetes bacterium]|nr:YggS family pyridoxal phosphate-dependent enzyme [Bacteroidota bacterium]